MWRRTTRDRALILGLVLATVVVLTLDFRTGVVHGVQGVTMQVVGVFQAGVRTALSPFGSAFRTVRGIGSSLEDIEQLQREKEELEAQIDQFEDIARERNELRGLLQITRSAELTTVQARVQGASLSGLERSVVIDKGSADGVAVDDAVISPEGLVGRIVDVRSDSAKVLLITDPQSSVGVRLAASGETGLVNGTGGGLLRMELVSLEALDAGEVSEGDVLVTSGYQGRLYPPGIPVGRIDVVEPNDRGTDYVIEVRPVARLSRLGWVSVVTGEAEVPSELLPSPSPTPTPAEEEQEGS